jgi:hypothetical protein
MKLKEKLLAASASIPFIAATSMSGSCAVGCPYGIVNCAYPGQCPRYTDAGGDGICDLSQSSTSTTDSYSASSTSSDSDSYSGNVPSSKSSNTDNQPDQSNSVSSDSGDTNTSVVTDQGTGIDNSIIPSDHVNYYVLPVSIMLIGAYLFTHYLFTKGILKRSKHRRIWNLLVTAGYAGTGITGVFLVLIVNLGIKTVLNPSVTFLHAELSILMVIGTIIHIHLYWKPFKNMFGVLFGIKSKLKKNKTVKSGSFSK